MSRPDNRMLRLSIGSMLCCAFVAACIAGCPDANLPGSMPGSGGGGSGGSTGTSGFPKTAFWTQRAIDAQAMADVFPSVAAVADLDKDGLLDIVVGYRGSATVQPGIYVFFQTDIDNFTAEPIAIDNIFEGISALAIDDLDGNGDFDIVAASDGQIVYLHGPPNPRLAAQWLVSLFAGSTGPDVGQWNDVAVGDIDGINGPDLVACGQDFGRLSWLRSPSADTTTGADWVRVDIDDRARTGAAAVALLDIDGDGRLDVFSTAPGEQAEIIAWYGNPSDPRNQPWTQYAIGNLPNATRLVVADLNADGREDAIVTNPLGRQIGWYIQPADPTTAWSGFLLAEFTSATPVDIQVADIDGNGQLDVVVATEQPGSLRWFTPIGARTDVWIENNLSDLLVDVGRIAVGDVDGDGRPDVAAPLFSTDGSNDSAEWFENPEP